MTRQSWTGTAILGAALMGAASVGPAPAADIGQQEYASSCAACHGTGGKGDGPLAAQLTNRAADLTSIEKNNTGVFPFARVYDVIDGRDPVAAHRPSEMPAWGSVYGAQAAGLTFGLGTPRDLDAFTRDRVIALIGHVYALQAK